MEGQMKKPWEATDDEIKAMEILGGVEVDQ